MWEMEIKLKNVNVEADILRGNNGWMLVQVRGHINNRNVEWSKWMLFILGVASLEKKLQDMFKDQ